jgi:hypothetical protein
MLAKCLGSVTDILTTADVDSAARLICQKLRQSIPLVIRIEGFCGSGKTTLSRKLVHKIGGAHVEFDQFAIRHKEPAPYPLCIRSEGAERAIQTGLQSGRPVVLDAVCLEEVAPSAKWGTGYKIYVKRLSFNNVDPTWAGGYNLEDDPPYLEPHRSVHLYHLTHRPHETADLIIEWPEEGHTLPSAPFSRSRCFDPT